MVAIKIATFFLRPKYIECVIGDLEEGFHAKSKVLGCRLARIWFWREAIRTVIPDILKDLKALAFPGFGHDAVHLLRRDLVRMKDPDIAAMARAEARILLTCDLGFGKIVRLSSPEGPSVILFGLNEEGAAHIIARIPGILPPFGDDLSSDAIVVVEDHRIRLHRSSAGR